MNKQALTKQRSLTSILFIFILYGLINQSAVAGNVLSAGVCTSVFNNIEEHIFQCNADATRYIYVYSRFPKNIPRGRIVEGCTASGPCFTCPPGSYFQTYTDPNGRGGVKAPACIPEEFIAEEESPEDDCIKEGNPCNPATGNKTQVFIDYASSKTLGLIFKRTYRSQSHRPNEFAAGWQHNYSSTMNPINDNISPLPKYIAGTNTLANTAGTNNVGLQQSSPYSSAEAACLSGWIEIKDKSFRGKLSGEQVEYVGGNLCHIMKNSKVVARLTIHSSGSADFSVPPIEPTQRIVRGDGSQYFFKKQGSLWIEWQHPETSLVAQGNDWLFTDANNTQELYDDQGRLQQTTTRQGHTTILQHDIAIIDGGDGNPDTVDKVTGPFGQTLVFTYQGYSGKIGSITTPNGVISYTYNSFGNLIKVTFEDGKNETYHYENTDYPHHLTGLTNERNIRFATWDYDSEGRAILSEHAGHTEKVTFVYNANGTTTVTGALGSIRTYYFDWIKGNLRVKSITGDKCTTCGNGYMKERSYDANGYLLSHIDWNENVTTYTHDATGLELSRTEAYGTPEAITITTDWHTVYRVPIKVIKGNKETEYSYDTQGRLLSQTTRNVQ